MPHVDETVTVTLAQRAVIEQYDLRVTEEFGHVVVCDPTVLNFGRVERTQVGHINDPAQGRQHAPAEQLDELLVAASKLRRPIAPAATVAKAVLAVKTAKVIPVAVTVPVVSVVKVSSLPVAPVVKAGVIGSMLALLADGTKRTRGELYEALVAQFPDRASAAGGMRVTISVQLIAQVKKGHNIVSCASDRGKLYYTL